MHTNKLCNKKPCRFGTVFFIEIKMQKNIAIFLFLNAIYGKI